MSSRSLKWDVKFINLACYHSTWSKDQSTKVGAVIVGNSNEILSTGYNGFPRGVNEAKTPKWYYKWVGGLAPTMVPIFQKEQEELRKRWERPMKYLYTEHAERNAIYNAARVGAKLEGSTLYMNFYPLPCADCARAVIQAGISCIIGPDRTFPGVGTQWKEHMVESETMLREARVEIQVIPERVMEEFSE